MNASVNATETFEIQRALAALCPDWTPSQVRVERFLTGGYSNRNYRLGYGKQRFVLRLPGTNSATDFVAEFALRNDLQTAFDAVDTSQPQMRLAETIAAIPQQGFLLTRWFERPVLASVADVSAVQLGEYLAALHQRLRQIPRRIAHSSLTALSEPKGIGCAAELIDSVLRDLGTLFPEASTQQTLRAHLAALTADTSPAQVCHVDLNPWNLLFDGANSWVTLDWETLNLAPPLFDLVVLCDGYALNHGYSTEQTLTLALDCLGTYNALMHTTYSVTELASLRALFHWREYAWAAARLAQGTLRSAVLDDVVAQRRDYATLLAPQAKQLGVVLVTA